MSGPLLLGAAAVEAGARALHRRLLHDVLADDLAADEFEPFRDDWMADARTVLQAAVAAVPRGELADRIAAVLHGVYLDDAPRCQTCDDAARAVVADLLEDGAP